MKSRGKEKRLRREDVREEKQDEGDK